MPRGEVKGLTPKQSVCLDAIEYLVAQGTPPSIKALAEYLNVHPQSARYAADQLCRKQYCQVERWGRRLVVAPIGYDFRGPNFKGEFTRVQEETLSAIERYADEHDSPPTMYALAKYMGKHYSWVRQCCIALADARAVNVLRGPRGKFFAPLGYKPDLAQCSMLSQVEHWCRESDHKLRIEYCNGEYLGELFRLKTGVCVAAESAATLVRLVQRLHKVLDDPKLKYLARNHS